MRLRSDIEVISLMLEMLELAGCRMCIWIWACGHLSWSAKAAGLSAAKQRKNDALQRKAMDEIAEQTAALDLALTGMLRALARFAADGKCSIRRVWRWRLCPPRCGSR